MLQAAYQGGQMDEKKKHALRFEEKAKASERRKKIKMQKEFQFGE